MSDLEEEMRLALFGAVEPKVQVDLSASASPVATPKRGAAKAASPKLRVTLHVTKEFEGEIVVLVHDVSTLSTLTAEMEAKALAKKLRYRYFEVVSTEPID